MYGRTDPGAGCCRDTYRKEKDTLSVKQVGKTRFPLGEHRSGCHEGEACAQSYAMMMKSVCRILQIFLEEYGESREFPVDCGVFSDGKFFLQQLETGKQYDLLFLDIIMKHVDGIRVGEFVRNRMKTFIPGFFICPAVRSICRKLFDSQPDGFLESH